MTRPTVTFDEKATVPGKPFVLSVPLDEEELNADGELACFLSVEDLGSLVADAEDAEVKHLQASCRQHVFDAAEVLGDGRNAGYCQVCDLELVEETDGTLVPVGEGS